jgi:hypothetical protein
MRRFILVAAISLVSATAYAFPSGNLTLASSESAQPATEQSKADQTAGAPQVELPKLAGPQEQANTPVMTDKPADSAKPNRKRVSTEARIISELHRHGIYW